MDINKNQKQLIELAEKLNYDIDDYLFAYYNDYKELIKDSYTAKLNYINIIKHYIKRFKTFAEKNNCKFKIFYTDYTAKVIIHDNYGNTAEICFSNLNRFRTEQKILVEKINILI